MVGLTNAVPDPWLGMVGKVGVIAIELCGGLNQIGHLFG